MGVWDELIEGIAAHWPTWLVTVTMVVAAVIDGRQLKVPNWLTFSMIISGLVYSSSVYGWTGLGASLCGAAVGLLLLLPAYAIGGMGAGDVKLLGGAGSWMYVCLESAGVPVGTATAMFHAFAVSAIVGAVLAIGMVIARRAVGKHWRQLRHIVREILTVGNPSRLAELAKERKPRMLLLPYGIPLAIGTIGYFAWMGMLL
ncbi:MAG: prepilin peptidase [Pirellulaceae bacterium]|nr:MAG: prepilin peptidase [Pirellulaceae bacterium]